jgi:hypothetical protein
MTKITINQVFKFHNIYTFFIDILFNLLYTKTMDNTNEDQKEQWKKDALQLKKDLQTRPKVYKKNEVDIKFGSKSKTKTKKITPNDILKSSPEDDQAMRRFLGI